MVTVIARREGGFRILVKGAAEIILRRCTAMDTTTGSVPLTDAIRRKIEGETIVEFANMALRVLCLAYRDVPQAVSWEDDDVLANSLTMSCLVGIQVCDDVCPCTRERVCVCVCVCV